MKILGRIQKSRHQIPLEKKERRRKRKREGGNGRKRAFNGDKDMKLD